jgi:phosphatidylserine/phosphatidylglycerophosphate/cardiolipin synthase-like enzyme
MINLNILHMLITITLILITYKPIWAHSLLIKNAPTEVYFSPNGGCQDAILTAINSAKNSIMVQAYSFTSAPIAEALKRAHSLGVNIYIILDRSQETGRYSGLTYLQNAGIPVWIDRNHTIAHNKVIIIDNETVITGSFNFTKSAEKSNAENIIIIRDSKLAQLYINNWKVHKQHAELPSSCNLHTTR